MLAAGLAFGVVTEPAFGQQAHGSATQRDADWPAYNGGVNGDHYSPLAQINRTNVAQLKVAWQFDTGEKGNLQTNPLIVGRVLYACTFSGKAIALDATTGRLLWTFDSSVENRDKTIGGASQPSRGLAYWTDGKSERIFAGVMNYLYALDAKTGKPIADFGDQGRIDLRKGLREDLDAKYEQQSIALTTPGVMYKDLIIVGGRNPETHPAPPGDIRAYDVRTGALRWSFHTIPHPGEFGYDTWPPDAWKDAGAANNWSGMTLDRERGIVYRPDGFGGIRFLRRRPDRERSLREHAAGAGCEHGQTAVAFPGGASRHLGPGFSCAAGAGDGDARRQAGGCGGADDQAGRGVSVRSRDGRAAVSHRGACVSGQRCSWREDVADPADAAGAGAVCAAEADRRHADHAHARGACVGGEGICDVPQRGAVYSVQRGSTDGDPARVRWWRGVGRACGGSGNRRAVCERERDGMDGRPDGGKSERARRGEDVSVAVRDLSWSEPRWLAAGISVPGGCEPAPDG